VKSHLISTLVLLAVCSAGAAEAQTQTPTTSRRPYKALFGGAAHDPAKQHALDFSFSFAEAYDDDVLADVTGVSSDSGHGRRGFVTTFDPTIAYAWNGKTLHFSATAGSNIRYYRTADAFLGSTHFGAVGFTAATRRTQLTLNQSATYSPAYFYGLFPSLVGDTQVGYAVGATGDYAVNGQQVLVYDTAFNLTQGVTSRSRIMALADFRYSDLSAVQAGRQLRAYNAGGRYLYDLSRNATLRLGYVYRDGQYVLSDRDRTFVVHDIDAGIDYHRPLSFSRRTRVDFAIGSSILSAPASDSDIERLQYRVTGTAGLTHDMGRTWRARVEYRRGVGFIEAVGTPVYSDGANATLDGFFTRRTDFHVGGGLSVGDAGLTTVAIQNRIRTYTATARVRTALNETWAVFGEYLYYNYDMGAAVVLADRVPRTLDRNTLRVGISVWLPVVRD
jgi:hypothetical protein